MSDRVELTAYELVVVARLADARNADAERANARGRFGARDGDRALDLPGLMGELAAAKFLGVYPTGTLSRFHEELASGGFDLPCRVGVRSSPKWRGLLIRPADPDDGRFVAAYVPAVGEIELTGWLYGHEAKQDRFYRMPNGRPPCWIAPETALRPLSGLREIVAYERLPKDDA